MLNYEEKIDISDSIDPILLKYSNKDDNFFKYIIPSPELTKGEYDRIVKDCESEIINELLENMFGISLEDFNINEIIKNTFFENMNTKNKEYYINIIYNIFEKYRTIEETYELFENYDNNSFDNDYDNYSDREDDCDFVSSDEEDNDDDDDEDQ